MCSAFLALAVFPFGSARALPRTEVFSVSVHNIKRTVTGPVISANFPDPCVIEVNNVWYAFATRTKGTSIHIQIASSTDFDSWTVINDDALPNLPSWVNSASWNTWAPDVNQLVRYLQRSDASIYGFLTSHRLMGLSLCILLPVQRQQTISRNTASALLLPALLKDPMLLKRMPSSVICQKEERLTLQVSKTIMVIATLCTRLMAIPLVM